MVSSFGREIWPEGVFDAASSVLFAALAPLQEIKVIEMQMSGGAEGRRRTWTRRNAGLKLISADL